MPPDPAGGVVENSFGELPKVHQRLRDRTYRGIHDPTAGQATVGCEVVVNADVYLLVRSYADANNYAAGLIARPDVPKDLSCRKPWISKPAVINIKCCKNESPQRVLGKI